MRDGHRGRRPGRSSESRCEVQPLRHRKTVVKTGFLKVREVYFFTLHSARGPRLASLASSRLS